MIISRYISTRLMEMNIPKDKWILEEEFISTMDQNPNFDKIHISTGGINYVRKEGNFRLHYALGKLLVFLDHGTKLNDQTIVDLFEVAKDFDGFLQRASNDVFPVEKIKGAYKRLNDAKDRIKPSKQTDLSFGQNNVWLVLKGDFQKTFEYFSLESGPSMDWETGIMKMERNEGILAFYHDGYTYLAGQQVENLFQFKPGNDEELERQYFQKLSDWSKTFEDVQFYLHYDKLFYANAFYRFLNQELVYGEFYTEGFENDRGNIPPSISSLYDTDANNVSEVWGVGPESFKYIEGVRTMEVFVCKY